MLSITDDGRTCTKCREFKPWSEFYSHPKGVNGKNPRCKACFSVGTRARAHVLKQRAEIDLPAVKRCARCGEIKASTEFTRCAERADGLVSHCRQCRRLRPLSAREPEYQAKGCRCCGVEKPLTAYFRAKASTDGVAPNCKECVRARARQVEDANRALWAAGQSPCQEGWKRCGDCGLDRSKADFSRSARCKDGLTWRCRDCEKQYHEENRETILARHREYSQTNKARLAPGKRAWARANPERIKVYIERRRALKLAHGTGVTFDQWQAIKALYEYRCLACGRKPPEIALEMDHVAPLSRGGAHDVSNVQPLCRSCNARKAQQTIDYRPT